MIGIASGWSLVMSSKVHVDQLALESKAGAIDAGNKAIIFNTITVSDGILRLAPTPIFRKTPRDEKEIVGQFVPPPLQHPR